MKEYLLYLLLAVTILGIFSITLKGLPYKKELVPNTSLSIKPSTVPTAFPKPTTDPNDEPTLNPACNFRDISGYGSIYDLKAKDVSGLPFLQKKYVDLGNNNLTSLPYEKFNQDNIEQLSLVLNNFSKEKQLEIQRQFPKTKIYFYPQTYDSSGRNQAWKQYISQKGAVSFYYPTTLAVTEKVIDMYQPSNVTTPPKKENYIEIINPFTTFEYSWTSCATPEAYIRLTIEWKDEQDTRSIEEYIGANQYQRNTDGSYTITRDIEMRTMIAQMRDFTIGNVNGIYTLAAEGGNRQYVVKLNNRFYTLTMRAGGEEGSEVGNFPQQLMLNIIGSLDSI